MILLTTTYHTKNAAAKGCFLKNKLTGSNPGIAKDAPALSSSNFLSDLTCVN
jgi:hypothetical protein